MEGYGTSRLLWLYVAHFPYAGRKNIWEIAAQPLRFSHKTTNIKFSTCVLQWCTPASVPRLILVKQKTMQRSNYTVQSVVFDLPLLLFIVLNMFNKKNITKTNLFITCSEIQSLYESILNLTALTKILGYQTCFTTNWRIKTSTSSSP